MFEQLDLFSFDKEKLKIKKPVRLIELFAGIGSQAMALRDLGIDFEHYMVVEFDRFAIASYNAIHGTNFNTIDIREMQGDDLGIVNKEHFTYLLTYSFPCTDLSIAGKQEGMSKGSGTRSGLLWEVERLLDETKELPQILVMENVPQVHSSGNIQDFRMWIEFLKSKGYSNYYQDLNARDYGVAQNRNRCFMISVLDNYKYVFPEPIELKKVLKDYIEDEVDDKYYIITEKAKKLIDSLVKEGKIPTERNCYNDGISSLQADGTGVIDWNVICKMRAKNQTY
jgi:DNA (cytosine-5)-methyltransferase 1